MSLRQRQRYSTASITRPAGGGLPRRGNPAILQAHSRDRRIGWLGRADGSGRQHRLASQPCRHQPPVPTRAGADHRFGTGQDQPGAVGGAAASGRLPRAAHGVPRGRPVRPGDRPAGGPALELALTGDESAGLPADSQQPRLAGRRAAGRAGRHRGPEVRLEVVKQIPVAAGLAGGSADAAATLVACDRLWGLGLAASRAGTHWPAELGSDVAFALLRWHRARFRARRDADRPAGPASCTGCWPPRPGRWPRRRSTPSSTGSAPGRPERSELPGVRPDLVAAPADSASPAAVAPLLANELQPAALALAPYLRGHPGGRPAAGRAGRPGQRLRADLRVPGRRRRAGPDAGRGADSQRSCRFARAVIGGVPGATVLDQAAATG